MKSNTRKASEIDLTKTRRPRFPKCEFCKKHSADLVITIEKDNKVIEKHTCTKCLNQNLADGKEVLATRPTKRRLYYLSGQLKKIRPEMIFTIDEIRGMSLRDSVTVIDGGRCEVRNTCVCLKYNSFDELVGIFARECDEEIFDRRNHVVVSTKELFNEFDRELLLEAVYNQNNYTDAAGIMSNRFTEIHLPWETQKRAADWLLRVVKLAGDDTCVVVSKIAAQRIEELKERGEVSCEIEDFIQLKDRIRQETRDAAAARREQLRKRGKQRQLITNARNNSRPVYIEG